LTQQHGVLLIFHEVVTGFRVSPGGDIRPDLTTPAKILADGLPGGAVALTSSRQLNYTPDNPLRPSSKKNYPDKAVIARSRRRRSNLDRGGHRRPEIASLRSQ
jgi:hypothetical protein